MGVRRCHPTAAPIKKMAREVYALDLDSISTRDDNPNQVREFNYIFKYSAIDSETGEVIAQDEFRTIASDVPLNLDEAKNRMSKLIETAQT